MLKTTTWILIAIAVALGGGVYLYEVVGKQQKTENLQQQTQIFDFAAEDISSITIVQPQQTLEFVRGENANQWRMQQPEDTIAEAAVVEFLVNLVVEGKRDRQFSASVEELSQYGLDQPLAKITIRLKNQQEHRLILGKPSLNDQSIYAQIDPDADQSNTVEVALIPKNFQYAVERELDEWQQSDQEAGG